MSRSRVLDLRVPANGKWGAAGYQNQWIWNYETNKLGTYKSCIDEAPGWGQDNPLSVRTNIDVRARLNGERHRAVPPYDVVEVFENYPLSYGVLREPGGKFTIPSFGGLAIEGAAAMNPSTPHISVPAFLGELRDLPALFRSIPQFYEGLGKALRDIRPKRISKAWTASHGGARPKANGWLKAADDLLRTLGGANLAYRFGWRPFLGDLAKILGFTDALNQRLKWLERLQSGKCIKRRHMLPPQSASEDHGVILTFSSYFQTVRHSSQTQYSCKSWITSRWKPGSSWAGRPALTPFEATRLATRLTYGITSYEAFAAGWELLPWSWLADWFTDVGDWIASNNNSLDLTLKSMCYMRTMTSLSLYNLVQPPSSWVAVTGPYYSSVVRKERWLLSTLPAVMPSLPSLPALTDGQWSILGSLAATRNLPGYRGSAR